MVEVYLYLSSQGYCQVMENDHKRVVFFLWLGSNEWRHSLENAAETVSRRFCLS